MLYPNCFEKRSQDLKDVYHDAGQFYWASPKNWCNISNIFENSRPLIIPRWRVQDIDTEEDWERAEILKSILEKKL